MANIRTYPCLVWVRRLDGNAGMEIWHTDAASYVERVSVEPLARHDLQPGEAELPFHVLKRLYPAPAEPPRTGECIILPERAPEPDIAVDEAAIAEAAEAIVAAPLEGEIVPSYVATSVDEPQP